MTAVFEALRGVVASVEQVVDQAYGVVGDAIDTVDNFVTEVETEYNKRKSQADQDKGPKANIFDDLIRQARESSQVFNEPVKSEHEQQVDYILSRLDKGLSPEVLSQIKDQLLKDENITKVSYEWYKSRESQDAQWN